MNSGMVFAENDECTAMMFATTLMVATWHDIADEIEIELVVERGIDRVRPCHQEERIPVRRRIHDRLGGDVAAGTRPVLDDERLAEPL